MFIVAFSWLEVLSNAILVCYLLVFFGLCCPVICFFVLDQLCLLDIQRELTPLHQKLLLWLQQPSPIVRSQEIHSVLPWLLVLSSGQINSPDPHHYCLTSWTIWCLGLYRRWPALATPSTSSLLEVPVGAPTDAPVPETHKGLKRLTRVQCL